MRFKARTAAVVMAGALLLGGCAADPRAAAVVDGRSISQARLEQTQQDLSAILTGADPGSLLIGLAVAPYFIETAAEHGVGVSVEEARSLIAQNVEAAGADPSATFGEGAVEVVRFTMAVQNLQSLPDGAEVLQGLDAEVLALDIDINPRYGELDPETGTIVEMARPWIVATQA